MVTPNPFSMPPTQPDDNGQNFNANTTTEGPFRHGSAEQGGTSSYFNSMHGDTPVYTPRASPRRASPRRSTRSTPRERSPAEDRGQDEEEYEARRKERRESRSEGPVGVGSD